MDYTMLALLATAIICEIYVMYMMVKIAILFFRAIGIYLEFRKWNPK
jgi:hypothetical protein